jgi:putative redox protein
MRSQKVFFPNRSGIKLAAYVDLPDDGQTRAFATLAHCFTCSKFIKSYNHISRALCEHGMGVLRLDFTGIGESQGEFSETTFQTNIDDLVDAAGYLEQNFQSPQLLIGHSLGGVASLAAAQHINSSRAITVIGTPDETIHLYRLLSSERTRTGEPDKRAITLGGKTFNLSEKLLESLRNQQMHGIIENLNKALLVLHAPDDDTVSLGSGERIFASAQQPKSFVSLDSADHLLNQEKDARYAGHIIANWVSRYLQTPTTAE